MHTKPKPGSLLRLTALAASLTAIVTACTGSDDADVPPEDLDLPYDYSLFAPEDEPSRCQKLPELIPDTGFMDLDAALEIGGTGNDNCDASQHDAVGYRSVGVDVYGQWDKFGDPAPDRYEELISNINAVPVDGIGEKAAFIPIGAEGSRGAVFPTEVSLLVLEGNLVLTFGIYSHTDIGGPDYRLEDLPTSAATAIGTAEAYLADLGAENRLLQPSAEELAAGVAVLPDLCSELDLGGNGLADDQPSWADDSDTMDRCHWQTDDTDLWLSAEAVGPLEAAGLSGEGFASWWIRSLPSSSGQDLLRGDESYASSLSADEAGTDIPTRDFAIRIGNVILQGRYAANLEHADVDAGMGDVMDQISSQVQSLLEEK